MNARIWGVIAGAVSGGCLLLAAVSPTSAPYLSNLIGAALLAPALWWLSFIGLPAVMREDPAIWANLLWKEWREHRWKLAALTAIYLITFAICLLTTREELGPFANAVMTLPFVVPFAALFIGMGITAQEQANGTADYLRAMPTTMRRVAISKLSAGLVTILAPIALLMLISTCLVQTGWWPDDFDSGNRYLSLFGMGAPLVEVYFLAVLASASILVWVAVLGMNQPSELRAGVIALVVIVALWLVSVAIIQATRPTLAWSDQWTSDDPVVQQSWSRFRFAQLTTTTALPGGVFAFATATTIPHPDQETLTCSALTFYCMVHGLLVWRWVTAYGDNPNPAKRRAIASETPAMTQWLGPPRPSPLRAILWKQVRECLPIIAGVIALAVGYVIILDDSSDLHIKVWAVFWMTAMSGFLAALLVGVASFQDDLNTGLSGFWRSRPIDPDQWFWTKYVCGFIVLSVVFGGVYALSQALYPYALSEDWLSPPQAAIAFWAVYSSAVCIACLVRNVIYAGILSFAVSAYSTTLAFTHWWDDAPPPVAFQLIFLAAVSVGLTLLAWQAMRRDWALRLA